MECSQTLSQGHAIALLPWSKDWRSNGTTIHPGYTLSVQNIRNTFLILSCTPFIPQNSLNLSGHGLYKVSKAFHRHAGPCWLQCFPQLCQVVWMSFGWWTILDTHRKMVSVKNPAVLQFWTHSNRCAWHLLPYPVQRYLNILSWTFNQWKAHIHNPCLNSLKA
jgi:hypothetical protein